MAIDTTGPTGPNEAPVLREPGHRVSPRAVRYWLARAAALLASCVGVQVGLAGLLRAPSPRPVDAWHLPLLVVSAVRRRGVRRVMPPWRYRVHRWEVTALAVYTQTGWLRRERRIAPLSRVQTVDTEQGAIARLFGLAKVTVTTASAAGPLVIDGLDRGVAADLVERLTAAAGGRARGRDMTTTCRRTTADGRRPETDRAAAAGRAEATGWHRLAGAMLLIQPVRELIRAIPLLVALVFAGRAAGGHPWSLVGVALVTLAAC